MSDATETRAGAPRITGVYLADCVGVIRRECEAKECRQKDVALSYAFAIKTHHAGVEVVDWPAIHDAIRKRWSDSAVMRVKVLAWKIVEGKVKP